MAAMSTLRGQRGLYREETSAPGATYACVTDGSITMTITEGDYRLRGYLPAYDGLPTKAEYEANGGRAGL